MGALREGLRWRRWGLWMWMGECFIITNAVGQSYIDCTLIYTFNVWHVVCDTGDRSARSRSTTPRVCSRTRLSIERCLSQCLCCVVTHAQEHRSSHFRVINANSSIILYRRLHLSPVPPWIVVLYHNPADKEGSGDGYVPYHQSRYQVQATAAAMAHEVRTNMDACSTRSPLHANLLTLWILVRRITTTTINITNALIKNNVHPKAYYPNSRVVPTDHASRESRARLYTSRRTRRCVAYHELNCWWTVE